MKLLTTLCFLCCATLLTVNAQQITTKSVKKAVNTAKSQATTKTSSLTNSEIIQGLKEALSTGASNSVSKVTATDGFYKNALIKILLPKEMKAVESKLRTMGMGAQVDNFLLYMNRTAEDASKGASPIFLAAIKEMTIADGLSILKGNNDAATEYLKGKTNSQLYTSMKPLILASMEKYKLATYWATLSKSYNKIPGVKPVSTDISDYTTNQALTGIFKLIAQEEANIRSNPTARTTDILKKVFGN